MSIMGLTTLQSLMNAKLSKQGFLALTREQQQAHQGNSNDAPQPILTYTYMSSKLAYLYRGSRLI